MGATDAVRRIEATVASVMRAAPLDRTDATSGVSLHLLGDKRVAFVYSPAPAEEALLAAVRSRNPVPADDRVMGRPDDPFTAARSRSDVAALMAGRSPYAVALLLNAAHYRKIRLLYALQLAGVEDPADLPAGAALQFAVLAPLASATVADAAAKTASEECTAGTSGAAARSLSASSAWDAVQPDLTPAELAPLDSRMVTRMFCMLARYEALSGTAAGMQGAVPHAVFDVLERKLGVSVGVAASLLCGRHCPACILVRSATTASSCRSGKSCMRRRSTATSPASVACFPTPIATSAPAATSTSAWSAGACRLHPRRAAVVTHICNMSCRARRFWPTSGSFESNPPFANKVMLKNVS